MDTRFLLALGLLGVLALGAQGSPTQSSSRNRLLGSERCTWGPSYWCSGLRQSAHCGATTKCIRSVWESNPYPEDDDEVCQICKQMVQEARDQLQSNETQVVYLIASTYEKVLSCFSS